MNTPPIIGAAIRFITSAITMNGYGSASGMRVMRNDFGGVHRG